MKPVVNFILSSMLISYMEFDKESLYKDNMISLANMSYVYNDGLKGYILGLMGESSNCIEFKRKLDRFSEELLATLQNIENLNSGKYSKQIGNMNGIKDPIEEYWKNNGKNILDIIENIFCGEWKESCINIYLVPERIEVVGKSNPLILPVNEDDIIGAVQTLVHEMIHRHAQLSGEASLYSLLCEEARENKISRQETYSRIIHPLMFYAAWHIVSSIEGKEVFPLYLKSEFGNVKFFKNTINILNRHWDKYYFGKVSSEEFVDLFIGDYLSNEDRFKKKRMAGI